MLHNPDIFTTRRLLLSTVWRIALIAIFSLGILLTPAPLLAEEGGETATSDSTPANVIINEIHYNPDIKTEHVEFIELHNPGRGAVGLGGWSLAGAVSYRFPDDATLDAGGYFIVAQDPEELQQKYGVAAYGPYQGKLSNEGEEIILRDRQGRRVDSVDYGDHFPWPIVGDAPGPSIQLLNPALDNAQPGAWRSAPPTPGGRNNGYTDNPPPAIASIKHQPRQPKPGEAVTVTVEATDADGVSSALLQVQVVEPGAYIALNDDAYREQWTNLPMQADGAGRFHLDLPGDMQKRRRLIRYRVVVTDGEGNSVVAPYADDPQPNFAYFVYDDIPTWQASVDGGPNKETYDFSQMASIPVVQLITKNVDVTDALFMPPATRPSGYTGNGYLWTGTVVYDGEVYDHVGYRARGGSTRYATGKNMWKFNFSRGHRLKARDNYGRAYSEAWDKLNLSAVIQQTHRGYRGEQGMFEATTFRLFNLAGTEAPHTQFIHFRVIDDAAEQGPNQYDSDFWGLYLAIEQMDGRFLKEHDLPDGNLYRMEPGEIEKANQGSEEVTDWSDLYDGLFQYIPNPPIPWWRENINLEKYYGYRSILEAIHHYDVDQGKNFFYYHNPETDQWDQLPWDVDLTWADGPFRGSDMPNFGFPPPYDKMGMPGTGAEPFARRIFLYPTLKLEYENRMREIRDLLFNREQMNQLLDEYAAFIDTPADGLSMVDADRAMWDYNPIYGTRYVNPERTEPGKFYWAAEMMGFSRDFSGMLNVMRLWVDVRGDWIDQNILLDHEHPGSPTVTYSGPGGFPADQLRFESSAFTDPNGNDTFGGMKWRIAEVTDSAAPAYDPAAPILYEIDATYESPELNAFTPTFEPPLGSVRPGHAYRVRVRMKDNSGRWGHWSGPFQFIAGDPVAPPANALKLTEIMYNPAPVAGVDSDKFEFVELMNAGDQPLDLSYTRFDDGIDYAFDPGVTLDPGAYLVLARDRYAFQERYGFDPFDEYNKRLSNAGERIVLRDAYDRTLIALEYGDAGDWPGDADGKGRSLVLNDFGGDPADPTTWRASLLDGGSPGAADPVAVVINEVQPRSNQGNKAAIELYNPTTYEADVSHWLLSDGDPLTPDLQLDDDQIIPPDSYRVYTAADFPGQSTAMLQMAKTGGTFTLASAAHDRRTTGYGTTVAISGYEGTLSFGRYVSSDGQVYFVRQQAPTLGRANAEPYVGPVVISRIMYQPTSGDEYLELTNASDQTVKLYDPQHVENGWRLEGARFQLPGGLELPPDGSLLITPADAGDVCVTYALKPDVQVVGNFPGGLRDDGMTLTLAEPGTPGGDSLTPYIPVDTVAYGAEAPWPVEAAGGGAALQRTALTGFGGEPANWAASFDNAALRAAGEEPFVRLCNFEAAYDKQTDAVSVRWTSAEEANIDHFNIWREDGAGNGEVLITPDGVPAQGSQGAARYAVTDGDAPGDATPIYWLEMTGTNGETTRVGFTTLWREPVEIFMPIVTR